MIMTMTALFIVWNMKEMVEDTKGVIRSCKSKKGRQYHGQKIKDK
jgi:hypothetical protein